MQEHSDAVPVGHIPRSITVYARCQLNLYFLCVLFLFRDLMVVKHRGDLTRLANPGDHVQVKGGY